MEYTLAGMAVLLHRLGWSVQVPARRAAERDEVKIASSIGEVHGAALSYHFAGKLDGDTMSGTLDMGEYLSAKWKATRHAFGRGQGAGDVG